MKRDEDSSRKQGGKLRDFKYLEWKIKKENREDWGTDFYQCTF